MLCRGKKNYSDDILKSIFKFSGKKNGEGKKMKVLYLYIAIPKTRWLLVDDFYCDALQSMSF